MLLPENVPNDNDAGFVAEKEEVEGAVQGTEDHGSEKGGIKAMFERR